MAASDRRNKDVKMAADLKARGIFHGRRLTSPYPNSGGLTLTAGNGSAVNQRRLRKLQRERA